MLSTVYTLYLHVDLQFLISSIVLQVDNMTGKLELIDLLKVMPSEKLNSMQEAILKLIIGDLLARNISGSQALYICIWILNNIVPSCK